MTWVLLPIIGSGTPHTDPFRPLAVVTIPPVPIRSCQQIFPGKYTDCYVWVPDDITIPGGVTIVTRPVARSAMRGRNPNAQFENMEALP